MTNAQHARFIVSFIYRTCGIVVTSARLTSHSSGPSSFSPTLGACPGPNRPRRCRRGGRSSIIGDALISPGSSTLRAYLGGSPRPRPRPPEISTCCGLSRPGRRRRAAGHNYRLLFTWPPIIVPVVSIVTASRRRLFARPTVCARRSCPVRRREHGSRGPRPQFTIGSCQLEGRR